MCLGRELEVEDAEALLLAPRHRDVARAEVIDHVAQPLRRAPGLRARALLEQVDVVVERQKAALLRERGLHAIADPTEKAPSVHVLHSRTAALTLQKGSPAFLPERGSRSRLDRV